MRKLVFVCLAFVAMTFAACENCTTPSVIENDTITVEDVDSFTEDTVVTDTVIDVADTVCAG